MVYGWTGDENATDLVRLLELTGKLVQILDFRLELVRFIEQPDLDCWRLVA